MDTPEESINPIAALQWRSGSISNSSSIPKVDWSALKAYALRLRQSQWPSGSEPPFSTCTLLSYYNKGGLHLMRLLEFDDGERWVARVRLQRGYDQQHASCNLQHEVDTMALLREKSNIPVPRVYGYESTDATPVGVPFMLLEFIYGDTAMDLHGGYDVHQGRIPPPYRNKLIKNTAAVQAEMASIRFDKIGRVVRLPDGSYTIGPFPDLGGPFSTAAEYLVAWAKHAEFPWSGRDLHTLLPRGYREQLSSSIEQFPAQLADAAGRLQLRSGPFPLYHADLLDSNIIVDKDSFDILSVIDWEGASTVPWEAVEFPLFLTTTPPPMDAPWNYDEDGLPTSPNVRMLCQEKEAYLKQVKREELKLGTDQRLSTILENAVVQNLAGGLKLYLDPGKIGFYCRIIKQNLAAAGEIKAGR